MADERQRVDGSPAISTSTRTSSPSRKPREVVVEAGVPARSRLQLVVVVEDDLAERKVVDEQHAILREVLHVVEAAAALVRELHHRADVLLRDDDRRADVRLLDVLELARHLRRVVHLELLADTRLDAVGDVRRGHEQVEVELPLQPLADDLHVEQAEEPAAEAEAESLRRLGLVEQRPVVELQPLERVAELGVLVGVRREEPCEHHRLHVLVAGQRLRCAGRARSSAVSPTRRRLTSFRPVMT